MDLTKFDNLWNVVRQLGAVGTASFVIHDLETDGIELPDLNEIIKAPTGFYRVLEDGTLVKIVLYISDREERLIKGRFGFPKFHLFNCTTIQEMQSKGRSHRYKISCRKDGKFRFFILEKRKQRLVQEQELEVCGYCLKIFNNHFSSSATKPEFVSEGYLRNFLKCDLTIGISPGNYEFDYEAIPNTYSADWETIARTVKAGKNYTCEKCRWVAKDSERHFIHAHHIDGKKFNTRYDNITVLCIHCHSEEPGHDHIKITQDYRIFGRRNSTNDNLRTGK